MAILNSIRKRGFFLILIIAMALFAFILSDILTKGGGSSDVENTAAIVNGQEINRADFMTKVENYQRSRGANFPQSQAMTEVWDNELRQVLFGQQAEELGLLVSDDELSESLATTLANNPTFQDADGAYSEARVIEYAASLKNNPSAKEDWDTFIEGIKKSILQNRYINLVRSGMLTTVADGEQQYHFENDKIDIEFVYVPYTKIADEDITVSDSEIETYIRNNPKQFTVDPLVDIEYVSFVEEPSLDDIEAARVAMQEIATEFKAAEDAEIFVNDNSDNNFIDRWYYQNDLPASLKDTIMNVAIGDLYGAYKVDNTFNLTRVLSKRQLPDSVEARHILIPFDRINPTDSITRTKEQAKAFADSLMNVVKGNRSKFADLAKSFSSDSGSKDNGGHYDWYPYNRMVPQFRDFTFEGKTGDIGVVETNFGFHLIEIEGQKNNQNVIKIATVTTEIEPSEETLSLVFSESAKFEEAARNGDFTTAAEEKNLTPKPVNRIGEMDSNIPGVGENRSIVSWAFGEESNVGDVKRFTIGDTYVVARLTRKSTKEALMSVAEASATVTPILRKEKKAQKIRETISGTTLQEVATSQNVTVKTANAINRSAPTIPGAGNEPMVVGKAFGVASGESTDLIDGENGVYQIRVLSFQEAPKLDNYTAYINALKSGNNVTLVGNNIYSALKEKADIEDNRGKFY